MDTQHLQSFVAVAECGSVSEAARRLRIAQPALSRQIRALEADLSLDLLHRSVRGATLTAAGERLLPHALSVLRQLEALPDIAAGPEKEASGRVAIGLPTTASAVLSGPLLIAARRELPRVQLHLIESLSGYLTDWVQTGALDLSLLYDPEPGPHLKLEEIMIEDLTLTGPRGAFSEGLQEIPLAALARYPLVLPGRSHSLRRLVDSLASRHGARLDIALEVDSLSVIKTAIMDCGYFSVLAPAAIHAELAGGRVSSLPIVEPIISRSVALASSAVRGQTRACLEVAKLVLRLSRELQEGGVWRGAPYAPL